MSREVAVVAHSHWDREWYAPFETYQARLVTMLGGLLDLLERDPSFGHFHLDGQVAAIDDFLNVRPADEARVRALVAAGRLSIGPWYVLMDEFCVSGETIVRNLQLGWQRSLSLGARPAVGYLPDMFGHVAQMPQILAQAGVAHAVVWRGVPASVARSGFWWRAPDGSRVRAEYLPVGYAGGAFLPEAPDALIGRLGAYEEEIGGFLEDGWPLLLMNGGDHLGPQPGLAELLRRANRLQDHFRIHQRSLVDYLEAAPVEGLAEWRGELRSGARAPLLPGVLSSRVDIKQAAAATETALERMAEPLATLWLAPGDWPGAALERAWLEVVHNSAHDSICGCSADEVARAVRARYDSARALAAEVSARAVAMAGVATARAGAVVVNPLAETRGGLVELTLAGTVPPAGTQQLAAQPAGVEERRARGRDLAAVMGALTGDGWLGPGGRGTSVALADDPAGALVVTLNHDPAGPADPGAASAAVSVMAEVWARAGAGADRPLVVRVERAAWQRVLARVDDVPGWGWKLWEGDSGGPAVTVAGGERTVLSNGLVTVELDPSDGTFTLDGIPGQNQLVDEGDEGDTYNFSPDPDRPPCDTPERVWVEVLETGPVRGSVRVRRVYPWGEVVSDVEVLQGEAAARVTTSLDHHDRDHRLRVVFPLGRPVESTIAECAFASATRTGAEGGPREPAAATFPSRRFVTAGDLTVTHQGLLEYELVDEGRALAVTLLRAIGIISRPTSPARPNIAGPPIALRDAQMPGPQTFCYALARNAADPWRLADQTWTPLIVTAAAGGGRLADQGRRLIVEGVDDPAQRAARARVSSLRRGAGGAIEVRVFNPQPGAARVAVPGHSGVLVDLLGRTVGQWEEGFELGPWAFATARLALQELPESLQELPEA